MKRDEAEEGASMVAQFSLQSSESCSIQIILLGSRLTQRLVHRNS